MSTPSRRAVLKGAAATCGTCLLAACGGGSGASAPPPVEPPAGGLQGALARLSDIPVGGAVSADAPDGSVVLLTQPTEGEVVAFSAVCPHEGCSVAPDGDAFSCPCHGSQFDLSGEVTRGPARSGLDSLAVRVQDGQVLSA